MKSTMELNPATEEANHCYKEPPKSTYVFCGNHGHTVAPFHTSISSHLGEVLPGVLCSSLHPANEASGPSLDSVF